MHYMYVTRLSHVIIDDGLAAGIWEDCVCCKQRASSSINTVPSMGWLPRTNQSAARSLSCVYTHIRQNCSGS